MHIQEGEHLELRVKLCEGASHVMRVAATLATTGTILHIISLGSSYWMEGKIRDGSTIAHTGLWQDCTLQGLFTDKAFWRCDSYEATHHLKTVPGFFRSTQALAVLAMCVQVLSSLLVFVMTLLPKLTVRRLGLFVAIATSAASGIFILAAMIEFPTNYPDRELPPFDVKWTVSWCFGLDLLSMLACFSVCAMLFLDYRHRTSAYNASAA